jgi:cytidylate kinase
LDPDDATSAARIAAGMSPRFEGGRILLGGADVTEAIRSEEVSQVASRVAVHPEVRQALLDLQRAQRQAPGLVADGRDMGTVVFPDAVLKVYLTASVEARADRRHKQLIEKGFPSNIHTLAQELRARDQRDSERAAAPLKPAEDAYRLDSSELMIEEVVAQVLSWYAKKSEEM